MKEWMLQESGIVSQGSELELLAPDILDGGDGEAEVQEAGQLLHVLVDVAVAVQEDVQPDRVGYNQKGRTSLDRLLDGENPWMQGDLC